MTLSFLWAACASSAPPSATAADFAQVSEAERSLDVAHAAATDENTACVWRSSAGEDANAAAASICASAEQHTDADLSQRCEAARRLALHANAAAHSCASADEAP